MGSCIFGKYNVCTVTDVGHYVYDRSKRWLLNIQRCDIEKTTVEYRRQNIRVCQDHFTIHSFMTPDKKTLTWNAEPTLFRGAIENAMKLIPHQRSLPTCSTSACPFVRMPVREHNDHSYYRARSKDEAKKKKRIYFVCAGSLMGRCKAVLPGRLQIVGKIGSQTNF